MREHMTRNILLSLLAILISAAGIVVGVRNMCADNAPKPIAADDLLPIQTLRLEITQLQMRMQPLQQALNEKLQALNAEVTRVQAKYDAAGCQPDLQGAWNCTERERAAASAAAASAAATSALDSDATSTSESLHLKGGDAPQ